MIEYLIEFWVMFTAMKFLIGNSYGNFASSIGTLLSYVSQLASYCLWAVPFGAFSALTLCVDIELFQRGFDVLPDLITGALKFYSAAFLLGGPVVFNVALIVDWVVQTAIVHCASIHAMWVEELVGLHAYRALQSLFMLVVSTVFRKALSDYIVYSKLVGPAVHKWKALLPTTAATPYLQSAVYGKLYWAVKAHKALGLLSCLGLGTIVIEVLPLIAYGLDMYTANDAAPLRIVCPDPGLPLHESTASTAVEEPLEKKGGWKMHIIVGSLSLLILVVSLSCS